ncbi:IS66 family insertion sequence element accessory protein TnpB [Sinorhizobium meliloti]|nr:IS66 family insertion sequence element accessory protein TnpB [Sinorhizobium meliloti]MDE3878726.1 IS66 family insertion sequence element accessory protein TnpB [Sinorhizobium meliloti]
MIVAGQRLPILIATRPVDFRCGHQALALMVQTELKLDPHSGVTVIFRSKRGDRLKILVWDGTGMVLTYKKFLNMEALPGPRCRMGRCVFPGGNTKLCSKVLIGDGSWRNG